MDYNLNSEFHNYRGIYPTAVSQQALVNFWSTFDLAALSSDTYTNDRINQAKSAIVNYNLVPGGKSSAYSVRIAKIVGGQRGKGRKNFEKRSGYAQQTQSIYDEFSYDYTSQIGKYSHAAWLACGQPLLADIPSFALDDISRLEALESEDMFFSSIFDDLYKMNINGSMPRTSRAVAGVIDYAYEADETLPVTLAEGGANDINNVIHAPTLKHIKHLVAKFRKKNALGESIKPSLIDYVHMLPAYEGLLVCSRQFYNVLSEDPQFIAQYLARGYSMESQPNSVQGLDWRGKVEGLRLVICDRLDDYISENYAGANIAWSFVLGAQAFMQCIVPLMGMTRDVNGADNEVLLTTHMVKGCRALRFPCPESVLDPAYVSVPNNNEEQGMIHSFTYLGA